MTQTTTSQIQKLAQQAVELYSAEYGITESDVLRLLEPSDFLVEDDHEKWVELSDRCPGDLEDYPHLVFCSQSSELGSATDRKYRPIA